MVPPVVGLLKTIAAVDALLHNTWFATACTVAIGLTVIVKVIGAPVQPFAVDGVTVIVAVVALVRLLFTQVYVVPDTGLVNTIGVVIVLAHNV